MGRTKPLRLSRPGRIDGPWVFLTGGNPPSLGPSWRQILIIGLCHMLGYKEHAKTAGSDNGDRHQEASSKSATERHSSYRWHGLHVAFGVPECKTCQWREQGQPALSPKKRKPGALVGILAPTDARVTESIAPVAGSGWPA